MSLLIDLLAVFIPCGLLFWLIVWMSNKISEEGGFTITSTTTRTYKRFSDEDED